MSRGHGSEVGGAVVVVDEDFAACVEDERYLLGPVIERILRVSEGSARRPGQAPSFGNDRHIKPVLSDNRNQECGAGEGSVMDADITAREMTAGRITVTEPDGKHVQGGAWIAVIRDIDGEPNARFLSDFGGATELRMIPSCGHAR